MKILSLHNAYRQRGGEDVVVEQERRLLREHGHEVIEYNRSNMELGDDIASKLLFAQRALWSRKAASEIRALVLENQPDVAHFHNSFPQISPSSYWECKRHNIPIVQTIHNYRIMCIRGDYFRDDHVCEDCLRWHNPLPALLHRCYRDSLPQSAAAAAALTTHRVLGTWTSLVDVFVALNEFGRAKLIDMGIPAHKISLKPNCVHPDPGAREHASTEYALFAGRLAPEKRVLTLIRAWEEIDEISLLIVGDGPKKQAINHMLIDEHLQNVRLVGAKQRGQLLELLKRAAFLVVPSEWYEMAPMLIVEAFACGVPVLASRLGGMANLIEDGKTGLLFSPGSIEEIRAKVAWAVGHPDELSGIAKNAREVFEAKYTAEANYPLMIGVYERAMASTRATRLEPKERALA